MENRAFEVVYEDKVLIVLNKRTKILVVPTPKKEKITLLSLLGDYLKTKNEKPFPVHRLDRETTGLILFAKNRAVQEDLVRQFRVHPTGSAREIKKKYIAFCLGRIPKRTGVIKGYILDYEGKKHKEKKDFAITKYRVLEEKRGFSVVEVEPTTGRTNQIRIHFKQIGHPLLGERRYVFGKDFPRELRTNRLMLHSYFLEFFHPVRKEKLSFSIDLPPELERWKENH